MIDDEDMAYYDSDGGVAVGRRHFSNGSIIQDDKMKIKFIDIADLDKDVTKQGMGNESEETEDLNDSAPYLWVKKHQGHDKRDDINNYNSPDNSNVQIP